MGEPAPSNVSLYRWSQLTVKAHSSNTWNPKWRKVGWSVVLLPVHCKSPRVNSNFRYVCIYIYIYSSKFICIYIRIFITNDKYVTYIYIYKYTHTRVIRVSFNWHIVVCLKMWCTLYPPNVNFNWNIIINHTVWRNRVELYIQNKATWRFHNDILDILQFDDELL